MKRKFLFLVITITLTVALPFSVHASERIMFDEFLPHDMDVDEMRTMIYDFVNVFQNEFPREITPEDIDFSRAYKIHVMTNIFTTETGTFPILVGGLPYFKWPVALFPDETGKSSRLVPISPELVEWSRLRITNQQTFEQNGRLDYSEIKSYISANPAGIEPFIIIFGLISFAVLIFIFVKRMRKEQ